MIRPLTLALAIILSCHAALAATPAASPSTPPGYGPEPAQASAVFQNVTPEPVPVLNPDGTFTVRAPLTSLAPVGPFSLRGLDANMSFILPVPERWEVKSASLSFSYVNSSSLIARLSRLIFQVGGHVLAQIELRPESPKGKVEIPIPGNLLPSGYNECAFSAKQSYSEEFCQDPSHPTLWTTLELDTAVVEITYALKPVPRRLSAIPGFLFDSRCFLGEQLNIVLPEYSESSVRQAALAASGAALRMDYQAVRATVSDALKPGVDNIVLGDPTFVRKVLGAQTPDISESTMAILPGPGSGKAGEPDAKNAIIVLSGTPEGLDKAVRAFSYLSFPFPDTPSVDLYKVTDPQTEMLETARTISNDKEYTLRSLGYFTRTVHGLTTQTSPINLNFTFPSGLDLNPNSYVTLSLHVAYAPGMRKDSVLAVNINDIFVGGVHFDDIKGGTFLDYRINLPLYAMKKGVNTLTLVPMLNPLESKHCEYFQFENLILTLYDDSTLTFPDVPLWVKLPDLGLFFQDVFPYALWPDMRDTTLLLSDKSPQTVAASLNLIAQASQRTGFPPLKLDVSFAPTAKGNVIAVGPVDSLPKDLVAAAPFSLLPQGKRNYPQMRRPYAQDDEVADNKAPLWSKFLPFLWQPARKDFQISRYLWADLQSNASISPGKGVVTQFKTPGSAADTVTLFTGATPADLSSLAGRLWEPAVRSNLTGDLCLVDLTSLKPKVTSIQAGDFYYIGKIGSIPKLTILINTYPWASLSIVLAMLGLFALASYKLLKAYKAKRK